MSDPKRPNEELVVGDNDVAGSELEASEVDTGSDVEEAIDDVRQNQISVLSDKPRAKGQRRPKQFKEVLKRLRKNPDVYDSQRENALIQYSDIISGRDNDGIHRKFYSDWSIDDFKALLTELGKELPRPKEFSGILAELRGQLESDDPDDKRHALFIRRIISNKDTERTNYEFPGWSEEDLKALYDELGDSDHGGADAYQSTYDTDSDPYAS